MVVLFFVLHTVAPIFLGHANSALSWNSFDNPHNVYNEFSDNNKSMKVAGMYEYTIRNFYVNFIKVSKMSEEEQSFLEEKYSEENKSEKNKYTGIFKGKNLILLQLEGMDEWLLNSEVTPNLNRLKEEELNFSEHYSTYTGGGSTFNSEFAVNTGFKTPISFEKNVYTYSNNVFRGTLPLLFKKSGYSVNAFHMNSKDFYSRGMNYKNWGYDNYFGLQDYCNYENEDCELDRELLLNDIFYKNMFQTKNKFVNYIITYSVHMPFSTNSGASKVILEKKYGENNNIKLSEEECAKLQAGETDYMVGLLIKALKDNNLYDNTVIVAFADHYLYTINKNVLDKYKNTSNNLINRTPFFIWDSDIKSSNIDKVNMQIDILPTLLNMFGISYDKNNYIGNDIFSEDYTGYAFFTDGSWYNGDIYEDSNKNSHNEESNEINMLRNEIFEAIRKNDLTLKSNYFRYKNR